MTMTTTIFTLLALLLSLWSIEAAINIRNAWGRRSTLNGLKISVRELQSRHDSDTSAESITLDAARKSLAEAERTIARKDQEIAELRRRCQQ